jgi:tRNA(adenine34) deaminase
MIEPFDDTYFMRKALEEAQLALEEDEIPVGAVVVSNGKIIGRGHNMTERLNDVTAHAEMLAITAASDYLGSKYLIGCTLYVSLEPCSMCAGALFWAQVSKVVFGASDEKRGYREFGSRLHPKTQLVEGVLRDESSAMLKQFFKGKRRK